MARLLPQLGGEGVAKLAPHADKLGAHLPQLLPLFPLLEANVDGIVRNIAFIMPHLEKLLPLAPHLLKQPQYVPYLLQPRVCQIMVAHLDVMPLEEHAQELTEMLPVVAPYLQQLAEDEALDLVLQRAESMIPLMDLAKEPDFRGELFLWIEASSLFSLSHVQRTLAAFGW